MRTAADPVRHSTSHDDLDPNDPDYKLKAHPHYHNLTYHELGIDAEEPIESIRASPLNHFKKLKTEGPELQEVTKPDGTVLRNKELLEAGLFEYRLLRDLIRAGENYSVRKNSGEELTAVAEHMYAATAGEDGWRAPVSDCTGPRPNQIIWPPQTSDKFNFVDV